MADLVHGDKTDDAARWLALCDRLDEVRERAGTGGYHASRELARPLADHDLLDELRDRISAGGGYHALARTLAREDRLDELRQRAERGDEHARCWLDEAVGRLACGSSGRKEGACRGWHRDPDAIAGSDREP